MERSLNISDEEERPSESLSDISSPVDSTVQTDDDEHDDIGLMEDDHDLQPSEWNQIENNSNREEIASSTRDLATIISMLVENRSRDELLATHSGGTFLLNARESVGAASDTDSDEGTIFGILPISRRCSSPPANQCPDNTKLMGSKILEELSFACSSNVERNNVTKLISKRENTTLAGHKRTNSNFCQADKAQINASFLPNKMTKIKQFTHKVFCGQYSTDGSVFLSACQDQHIRLFDTTNGRFKLFRDIRAKDFGWSIVDTAYSPDQRFLIYSSWSNCIHLCNIYGNFETHIPLDLRPSDSRFCAFSICFSQDNTQILAGGSDRSIYIYDRGSDRRSLKITGHYDDVNAVCFADDRSDILFSGSDDGLCKVWDRRELNESNPKPVGVFAGHTDGITYIDTKGDERYLLSNSKDQMIKLWDMRNFSPKYSVRECERVVSNTNWDYRWETVPRGLRRQKKINGDPSIMTYRGHSVLQTLIRARFSPPHSTGQKYIYAGCASGNIVLYDIITGEIAAKLKGHKQCTRDISWHPFEQTIMSSSWDGTVGRWQFSRSSDKDTEHLKRKCKKIGRWSVS